MEVEEEEKVVPELQYILNIHIVKKKKSSCSMIINTILHIIQIEMNKINDEINFIHSLTDHNNNNDYHNNDNDDNNNNNNNNNNHPLLHHLPSLEQYQDRVKLISSSMKTSFKKYVFSKYK